jgi:hypothetical protein
VTPAPTTAPATPMTSAQRNSTPFGEVKGGMCGMVREKVP